jgi:U4/U6.U5 tri-snRNP component SNU23
MAEAKKPQTNDRPGWDKVEWDAKAKAKDQQFAEQAKARDEALAQGAYHLCY